MGNKDGELSIIIITAAQKWAATKYNRMQHVIEQGWQTIGTSAKFGTNQDISWH